MIVAEEHHQQCLVFLFPSRNDGWTDEPAWYAATTGSADEQHEQPTNGKPADGWPAAAASEYANDEGKKRSM